VSFDLDKQTCHHRRHFICQVTIIAVAQLLTYLLIIELQEYMNAQ